MKFTDSVKQFWDARSGKERAMLCVAAGVVSAAALYLFLLEPGLVARKQLSATLPRLRAQTDDMRQQQKEIAVLRKKIGAASQRADLKALLESSSTRTPLVNSMQRFESISGDKVILLAAPVVFDEWLGWVENLQREFGVRLDACKIAALDQPGLVRIEATFVSASQLPAAKTR